MIPFWPQMFNPINKTFTDKLNHGSRELATTEFDCIYYYRICFYLFNSSFCLFSFPVDLHLLWKFFNIGCRRVIFEECQQTSGHETVRPCRMTVHRHLCYGIINPESCQDSKYLENWTDFFSFLESRSVVLN